MKLESRDTFGVRQLLLVPENEYESKLIDEYLGREIGPDGIGPAVMGEVRLEDGYAQHYIRLESMRIPPGLFPTRIKPGTYHRTKCPRCGGELNVSTRLDM